MSIQSLQFLEEAKVYQISNYKFTQITPKTKWSFAYRDDELNIYDGGLFYFQLSKEIVRIKYRESQGYYSKGSTTCFAILLPTESQLKHVVEYKLSESKITLTQWQQASPKTKESLQASCGTNITTKFNSQKSVNTGSLSYKIGGFFGAINGLIAKPSQKINEKAATKVQELKEEQLSTETKSNWNNLKDKAKDLNHKAGEVLKPARQTVGGIGNKIGQKFNKSQNSIIKGIRNFGNSLKDSLNQGYRNSRPSKESNTKVEELKAPESQRQLK